ncbi:MAG: energy-coupling factor transporter transmembrane protein EcfT [Chloroflexi bacterium]|nr:energy-coupling factor transporter transmembrane protein EcfT [Chloroflexota bacterium]
MSESTGHSLQYVYRDSLLHKTYPLVKLIWVFVVALGLFLFRTPLPGAVLFVAVLVLAMAAGRIPFRQIMSSAKLIFGLGIILMFFHFFADPGTPVYQLGPLTVTDGGLRQGPVFFFRLSVVVLSSFLLIWTTDSRDLMVSLTQAGISYRYAFAVFLALRFLPMVQREVDSVRAAHAIRGQAASSSLGHRFKLWQRYMFTVLVNGLRKAEATAAALDCRAFGLYPKRTYVKPVHYNPKSLVLLAVTLIVIVGLMVVERGL